MKRQRPRRRAVPAWLRLAHVFQKIDGSSERLFRRHGLTSAQFDVLTHVGSASGVSQQELADALLVTKGNVSQLLRRLELRRYIMRRQAGRTNVISLTDAGKEIYERLVPLQEAQIARLFAPLSPGEQHDLLRLLRKLDHGIDPTPGRSPELSPRERSLLP